MLVDPISQQAAMWAQYDSVIRVIDALIMPKSDRSSNQFQLIMVLLNIEIPWSRCVGKYVSNSLKNNPRPIVMLLKKMTLINVAAYKAGLVLML